MPDIRSYFKLTAVQLAIVTGVYNLEADPVTARL